MNRSALGGQGGQEGDTSAGLVRHGSPRGTEGDVEQLSEARVEVGKALDREGSSGPGGERP